MGRADAAVLRAISQGLFLWQSGGQGDPHIKAVTAWRDFFAIQQAPGERSDRDLRQAWGKAEQLGVDFGLSFARSAPSTQEQTLINTFVASGNIYRTAVATNTPVVVAGIAPTPFHLNGDPRKDRQGVYTWAIVTESAVDESFTPL